jgi:hypothetical protein
MRPVFGFSDGIFSIDIAKLAESDSTIDTMGIARQCGGLILKPKDVVLYQAPSIPRRQPGPQVSRKSRVTRLMTSRSHACAG